MGNEHVEQSQNLLSACEVEHLGLYTILDVQPPKGQDVDWTLMTPVEYNTASG